MKAIKIEMILEDKEYDNDILKELEDKYNTKQIFMSVCEYFER